MLAEINRLRHMSVDQLRDRWRELYGEESRSRNKDFLFRRLAFRLQEIRLGGLSDRAKARLTELGQAEFQRGRTPNGGCVVTGPGPMATASPRRVRDARLPVSGSVITKRYKGRELRVVVREDGFEYDGAVFGSLSALAREITGSTHINGKLFFNLVTRKR